jgi:hypothetical protein
MSLAIGITGGRFSSGGGGETLTIGVYSDAGLTTAITTAVYGETVYFNIVASNPEIVTTYGFAVPNDIIGESYSIIEQGTATYTWVIDSVGELDLRAYILTSTSATATDATPFAFTVTPISLVTDASTIARYSFEDDTNMVFNGSTISEINDLSGNGYHLSNASAAQQPSIYSTLTVTGRQYARFVSDQLAIALASGTNYTDMTICLVMGCDGNSPTTRVGSIVQAGQNDFNGADSIAMQETRMEKASGGGGGKYDRELSILFFRNVEGVGTITDFFTSDGRQLTYPVNNASNGGLTYQQVNMGRTNPSGVNIAEWHFIGRKLSDAETQSYGEYLRKKWLGV